MMLDLWAAGALAAVPFLPNGKGALILILGGLGMLAVALVFARFAPTTDATWRPGVSGPDGRQRGRIRPPTAEATESVVRSAIGMEWLEGLEAVLERRGLGRGRFVTADADRCVFFLADCRTCRKGKEGRAGCVRERGAIEGALARSAPLVRVTEISCNPSGRGACLFEIRRRVV